MSRVSSDLFFSFRRRPLIESFGGAQSSRNSRRRTIHLLRRSREFSICMSFILNSTSNNKISLLRLHRLPPRPSLTAIGSYRASSGENGRIPLDPPMRLLHILSSSSSNTNNSPQHSTPLTRNIASHGNALSCSLSSQVAEAVVRTPGRHRARASRRPRCRTGRVILGLVLPRRRGRGRLRLWMM